MMTDPLFVVLATVALIALSAFFVIIEFALLGARRHRLEEIAATSPSARAALRGMNDLTLMLAGAQLGITVCTFALGAITKPAVDAALGPVFLAWGLPLWAAGAAAFALAMFVVTFLHLVVGEMAPKSWAIAHPERSAMAIGLLARAYIWPMRPLLNWINRSANRLVKASGVEPVESAAVGGRDAATIRQLVSHSAEVGALEPHLESQLSGLIDLGSTPLADVLSGEPLRSVQPDATVADARAIALETNQTRLLMLSRTGVPSVVHLRDTLLVDNDKRLKKYARPAFILTSDTPVYEALARMRAASVQLAVVTTDDVVAGVVTLADILNRVLPKGEAAVPANAPLSSQMS